MKVTIITNGDTKLVLKPETQVEILAVKSLTEKPLTAELLETTQILKESYPNCLVVKATTENKSANDNPKNKNWIAVHCLTENTLLGIIPADSNSDSILSFIREQAGAEEVSIKNKDEIKLDEMFRVEIDNKPLTYIIKSVNFYQQW